MAESLCILNNNRIILQLLEEEEEEFELFSSLHSRKRKPVDNIYKFRESEGVFEILINRHLSKNETKFREYFHINYKQFDFLVSLIEVELCKEPSNRIKKPITVAEKLALTLRYLFKKIYSLNSVGDVNFFIVKLYHELPLEIVTQLF